MRTPRRAALAAALLAVTAPLLAGCGGGGGSFQGSALPDPIRPTTTSALTPTTGGRYDLASQVGHGRVTLVYFGYTHCPDVCPTVMADVAAALRDVPADLRAKTDVVFVATDPDRDTVPAVQAWLGRFGLPRAVGLTGPFDAVKQVATALQVGLTPPEKTDRGVEVGHGAQLLGFGPQGTAPVFWLPPSDGGPQLQHQLEHDLPLLAAGKGTSA